ncbi:MAG: manganese efflux pump [Butyrivibrio sp.]|nr:manganese efflux pump [Butyrivibrio sp.]
MGLFEVLLLAVGLAMDAFAVSICKGLAAGRVTKREYLLCGVWFGTFQGVMPLIGYLVGSNFVKLISIVAPWVAFVLLSLIGGNMIKEALGPDEEVTPGFDVKTMFMMAVATSIDALAVGITFVAVPVEIVDSGRLVNVVIAVVIIGVITCLISMAGVKIGSGFGDRYKAGSEIMGGTILLFIGFRALITHLDSANTLSDNETIFGMLIPLVGTLLGSLITYAGKARLTDKMRAVLVGFSSGIMLSAAVWGMIEPAVDGMSTGATKGIIPVTVCFCLGVIFQILLDKLIPHTHIYSDITEGPDSELSPRIKAVLKEVIHHIPEGMALGAIYAAHFMKTEWISSSVALALAIAIALQNIPEALSLSLWLRDAGTRTGRSFLMGVVSGAPIPLIGIITVVLVVLFPGLLPYIMSVSGGALIYTTIEEIPQIALKHDNDRGALAFAVGFAIVMLMIFM